MQEGVFVSGLEYEQLPTGGFDGVSFPIHSWKPVISNYDFHRFFRWREKWQKDVC
jgi:hypothetical protein